MQLYEEPAEYAYWLRLLYLIPVGLVIGAIILAYIQEYEGFWVLILEGIFLTLLFYFIMPRKYQIYQDKLRIALGGPVGINIPFSTIKEVKHSTGSKAWVYPGVRFATSTKYVLEIIRNRGMNYVISPHNGEIFLEQLNYAIKTQTQIRK
jgi:hypothetical protein